MKTTIWTPWDASKGPDLGKPRCIFNKDIPHLLRAGDQIVILKGFSVETIANVYYNIPDNSQEINIASRSNSEYPTVQY